MASGVGSSGRYRTQEVAGSSPASSTKVPETGFLVGSRENGEYVSRHLSASRARVVRRHVANSTYAELFRRSASRALFRDVHRRAAEGRSGGRPAGARLGSVRRELRVLTHPGLGLVRMAAVSRANIQLCGSHAGSRPASAACRRWASRTSRRSAPSMGRRFSTRQTQTRPRSSSPRWRSSTESATSARRAPRRR
jgi:hypothetical protein